MTITIPDWMLWLPVGYLVVGLGLVIPLLAWANAGIPTYYWHTGWNRWQPWLIGTLFWPGVIWELWRARDE